MRRLPRPERPPNRLVREGPPLSWCERLLLRLEKWIRQLGSVEVRIGGGSVDGKDDCGSARIGSPA